MNSMFKGIDKLEKITFYPYIKTSIIEDMEDMFNGCSSLLRVNFTKFDA